MAKKTRTLEARVAELESKILDLQNPHIKEIKKLKKELSHYKKLSAKFFDDFGDLSYAICGAHVTSDKEYVLKIAEHNRERCRQLDTFGRDIGPKKFIQSLR